MKKLITITILMYAFIITYQKIGTADNLKKLRVAVLEITAKNTSNAYADIIRDMIEINLYKIGTFEVLERKQIDLILKEQGLQMAGCTDQSCAIEIGKLLSADLIIVGSLSKISIYTLGLKLVNVKRGAILKADMVKAANENELETATERIIKKIFTDITPDANTSMINPTKSAKADDKHKKSHKNKTETRNDTNQYTPLYSLHGYTIAPAIYISYLNPVFSLNEKLDPAYGSVINLNFIHDTHYFGFQFGKWNLKGNEKRYYYFDNRRIIEDYKINMYHLHLGYNLFTISNISISTILYGGVVYSQFQTSTINNFYGDIAITSERNFDPSVMAGLCLTFEKYLSDYFFNKILEVKLEIDYGIINTMFGYKAFFLYNLGLGIRI